MKRDGSKDSRAGESFSVLASHSTKAPGSNDRLARLQETASRHSVGAKMAAGGPGEGAEKGM